MASITRTNGNVFSGVNVNTDLGSLVAIGGVQPACYAILLKDVSGNATNVDADGDAGESLEIVLRTVLEKGIISYYQIEASTPWQVSVMVERSAWTAAALQTAVRALGTTVGTNTLDVSGSTVTDVGFKLATS